ncbi:fumarylacetoacetate hydrolase [Pseudomonas protegens]|uniref:fumarylacetoacetate hydrolase n=1 Tax=Pseudomonas protegens TaxID=380021 RepID=UPI001E409DAF|nr:fumarylacetoacetate hydrolase [Pseudomonas protegens]MCD9571096.1 fumarylacetoacetate hydrolase [Pseudomonas protegens]
MDDYLLLLDVCHKDQRAIGLFDFHNGRNMRAYSEHGGLYETLLFCSRRHLGWSEHLRSLAPHPQLPADGPRQGPLRPPLKPRDNLLVQVSEVTLNTPHTRQGWFYKGNGSLLKTDGEPLMIPYHAQSISSQPGVVCVYLVDPFGQLRFVGFSLGHDIHDPLLSHQDASSCAQSRLRQCAIAPALILGELQSSLSLNVRVERQGAPLPQRSYRLDLQSWWAIRKYSQAFLEQHEQFLQPGMVHYVFHSASRRESDLQLQHGDWLDLDCPELELGLSNQVIEEELLHLYPLETQPARASTHGNQPVRTRHHY